MHKPEVIALFRRLLRQEIDCAERLAAAIDEERRTFGARDPAALERLTARKRELLQEMEQRVASHEGFLAARRLPPGRQGTESFMQALPPDAEEHGLWRQLRQLAERCRDGNAVNGRIVTMNRVRVQRALELLRGGADSGRTYGREGEARLSARRQFIGSV